MLPPLYRHAEAAHDLIDAYLAGQAVPQDDKTSLRRYTVVHLDTTLAEMENGLGRYLQRDAPRYKTQAIHKLEEMQALLQQLATLPLTAAEQSLGSEVTHHVVQLQALLPEIFTLHEALSSDIQQFLSLCTTLDTLLDGELQQFTAQGLQHAQFQAQGGMERLRLAFLGLLAVGLVLGVGVSLRLGGRMSRAVQGLVEGARAIGGGALEHRIVPVSRDDLAEVAEAFNTMAAQRQHAEAGLHSANATLETRVAERTAALTQAYETVQQQLRERQEAERALRVSEALYKASFDYAYDLIYVTNVAGELLAINPAVEAITGYLPAEVLGRRLNDLIAPERLEEARQLRERIRTGNPLTGYEVVILSKDGRLVTLEVNSQLLRQAGEPVVIYSIARDVSERQRLEAQVRHQQRLDSLGTMASGIAHDFNNFLSAILGYADLALLDLPPDSAAAQALQQVLTAGQRARDLVQQILTFSRKATPIRQPVVLHTIVQEVLTLLRASLPTTVTITQVCEQERDSILADKTQLHQVLLNLCLNAIQAMHDTGGVLDVRQERIMVDTAWAAREESLQPGMYLRLSIRDTGCGMTPQVISHIFEPFFTTKAPGQGTGMGLSVVHGIVTSHKGAITVNSTLGQGTTFRLYLPYAEAAEDSTAPATLASRPGQARVLCVDDDDILVALWNAMLTRQGYHVTACTDSVEALRLFREAPENYDIVVTDQRMPGLTGDALIRALRQLRPTLPIVLCTGVRHMLLPQQIQALDSTVFLQKPVDSDELARAIQQALARATDHTGHG